MCPNKNIKIIFQKIIVGSLLCKILLKNYFFFLKKDILLKTLKPGISLLCRYFVLSRRLIQCLFCSVKYSLLCCYQQLIEAKPRPANTVRLQSFSFHQYVGNVHNRCHIHHLVHRWTGNVKLWISRNWKYGPYEQEQESKHHKLVLPKLTL
jgi:hypothetical protein